LNGINSHYLVSMRASKAQSGGVAQNDNAVNQHQTHFIVFVH